MKMYGVDCTLLLMVEAENEDEAVEYAKAMLNEEHYCASDFNDIEATYLSHYGEW